MPYLQSSVTEDGTNSTYDVRQVPTLERKRVDLSSRHV